MPIVELLVVVLDSGLNPKELVAELTLNDLPPLVVIVFGTASEPAPTIGSELE